MILIKDNVERIVDTKEKAEHLRKLGYNTLRIETYEVPEVASPSRPAKPEKPIKSMTVKELRALAKKRGIEGASALLKSELIELLEE